MASIKPNKFPLLHPLSCYRVKRPRVLVTPAACIDLNNTIDKPTDSNPLSRQRTSSPVELSRRHGNLHFQKLFHLQLLHLSFDESAGASSTEATTTSADDVEAVVTAVLAAAGGPCPSCRRRGGRQEDGNNTRKQAQRRW